MMGDKLTFKQAAREYDLKVQTVYVWKRSGKITVIPKGKDNSNLLVVIDSKFLGALDYYQQDQKWWNAIRELAADSVAKGVIDLSILTDNERKIIEIVNAYKLKYGGHIPTYSTTAVLAGMTMMQFRYCLQRLVHIGYVIIRNKQRNIFLLGESWTPPTIIN